MNGLNDSHYVCCFMNPHPFHDECRERIAFGAILARQFIGCQPDPGEVKRLAAGIRAADGEGSDG